MAIRAETYDAVASPHTRTYPPRRAANSTENSRLARALGWFSIGLGAAEIIAPGSIAKLIGSRNHKTLLRSYGLREVAAGVGILTRPQPAPWLWSRVCGDMVDLASLGAVLASPRNDDRGKTVMAIAAVAGVTALDIVCAKGLSAESGLGRSGAVRAEANLMVNRQPEECYRFWRNFEDLPQFMTYLQSVRVTGDRQSHWVAKSPTGARIEWDAELIEDIPNEKIAWRSLPGADVFNTGSVDFERAPGRRGTIVRVQIDYGQPSHALASVFAKLAGKDPEQMVNKDLRRFKQMIETGEVITTERQSAGRTSGATWLDSIAR